MSWAKILLLITLAMPERATADDVCQGKDCGQGTCKPSDHLFGYECECKANWSQFHIGDHFLFLPCTIPKCSIDYSCGNESSAPAPSPPSSPPDSSIFNPCHWSTCGGGTCVRTSVFHHRCDCNAGYSNLLNVSSLPCIKKCSLGVDCAVKGILANASSPSPSPSQSRSPKTGSSSDSFVPRSLIWFFASMLCLSML